LSSKFSHIQKQNRKMIWKILKLPYQNITIAH